MNRVIIAAIASLLFVTSSQAETYNPYGLEDPGYAEAVKNWGKEILFAKYAAKNCPEYKIAYNQTFFIKAPPDLWEQKRYDAFMTSAMNETKHKLDAQQARLGRPAFCKMTVEFFAANYRPNNRPVFIDGK